MTIDKLREMLNGCLGGQYVEGRDFRKDVEAAFPEFEHLGSKTKSLVHQMAWEHGHAAGYHDVFNWYFDILEVASQATKDAIK